MLLIISELQSQATLYKNVLAYKQCRQHPHRYRNLLELAADGVAEHIGDNTKEDTVGDAVGKGHHDYGYEGGDGLAVVVPVNGLDGRHHHHAHNDEGGSGGCAGDCEEDGAQEQGQAEEHCHGEGGEAGAAAFTHSGCALHVGCGGGGAEAGACYGGDGIGKEHLLYAFNLVAALLDETCTLVHADYGAHGVEHVDEEEGEHHRQHVPADDAAPLELAEDRSDAVGKGNHALGEGSDSCAGCGILDEEADGGSNEDAPEHSAADLCHNQAGGDEQADEGYKSLALSDAAESHDGGIVVNDDAGVLHADEGDEQADTCADGLLKRTGDGIDEPAANLGKGEDDEQQTLDENCREGELPRMTHTEAHREHEEGVKTHAGGEGERLLGEECHHQGTYDCGECSGGEHCSAGHVKCAENQGVDSQDVGHREEGGEACEDLSANRVLSAVESEALGKEVCHCLILP